MGGFIFSIHACLLKSFIVSRLNNSKKSQDAKETAIRICFKLIYTKKGVNTWRRHFFFNLALFRGSTPKELELESMCSLLSCLQLLRDTFIFKIVPMLNPDGVIVGNYRCSLAGRDLNRNYKTVLKDSFPPIWHVRSMVRKWVCSSSVVNFTWILGTFGTV